MKEVRKYGRTEGEEEGKEGKAREGKGEEEGEGKKEMEGKGKKEGRKEPVGRVVGGG